MQHLLLTFRECMQSLFLRRQVRSKTTCTHTLQFWKFSEWFTNKRKQNA